MDNKSLIVKSVKALAEDIHSVAKSQGFWKRNKSRNLGEGIALIHLELSNALEAMRVGSPANKHLPMYKQEEVELADAVMRILDFAEGNNLKVVEALFDRLELNRVSRGRQNGKKF